MFMPKPFNAETQEAQERGKTIFLPAPLAPPRLCVKDFKHSSRRDAGETWRLSASAFNRKRKTTRKGAKPQKKHEFKILCALAPLRETSKSQ